MSTVFIYKQYKYVCVLCLILNVLCKSYILLVVIVIVIVILILFSLPQNHYRYGIIHKIICMYSK